MEWGIGAFVDWWEDLCGFVFSSKESVLPSKLELDLMLEFPSWTFSKSLFFSVLCWVVTVSVFAFWFWINWVTFAEVKAWLVLSPRLRSIHFKSMFFIIWSFAMPNTKFDFVTSGKLFIITWSPIKISINDRNGNYNTEKLDMHKWSFSKTYLEA